MTIRPVGVLLDPHKMSYPRLLSIVYTVYCMLIIIIMITVSIKYRWVIIYSL